MRSPKSYIFLNQLKIENGKHPIWSDIELEQWQSILKNVIFNNSNSFSFDSITCKQDLFPVGLKYFKDWNIEEVDLIEYRNDLMCRFNLNEDCKQKFLNFDFMNHSKNFETPINYDEYTENKFWYEFDIVYFFKDEEMQSMYVNHEQEFEFYTNEGLDLLEPSIKNQIIERNIFNDYIQKLIN